MRPKWRWYRANLNAGLCLMAWHLWNEKAGLSHSKERRLDGRVRNANGSDATRRRGVGGSRNLPRRCPTPPRRSGGTVVSPSQKNLLPFRTRQTKGTWPAPRIGAKRSSLPLQTDRAGQHRKRVGFAHSKALPTKPPERHRRGAGSQADAQAACETA